MVWAQSRQNERNLTRYRILLLMGAVVYPLWWFVFRLTSPEAVDPPLGRLIVGGVILSTFALSFRSSFIARNINRVVIVCACILTAHYFLLLHLNSSDFNYMMAAFVTVFAVSSCFISRRQILVYCLLVTTLSIAICVLHEKFPRVIFVSGLGTGLAVSYIAVSSRLRLIESLLASEERFRTMADTAPVMIWMSDERGACHFFNEVWLKFTGVPMDLAAGNGWTKSIHPEDLNVYLEKYFSAFRARRSFYAEYRLRRADGEFRWIFGQSVPLYQPNGHFEGYIGSCTDITESKKSESIPTKPV